MRLLICGTCPNADCLTNGALKRALAAWQVSMVVCFGANSAAALCRSVEVPVRVLPDDDATLETLTWLFSLGTIDRVLALPEGVPMPLYVRAFEHMVPVWEIGAPQGGRAELTPLTVGKARRRWLTPPMDLAG